MINEKFTLLLGSPIKREKSNDDGIDEDLIEIDHSIGNHVINKESRDLNVCIYDGPFESIFGKEVFKYRPSKGIFEVSRFDTPNTGSVASKAEHEEIFKSSGKGNGLFFVKSKSGKFSVKGESGTALVVKNMQRNVIKLIGIIIGGLEHYTVCHFLPIVLRNFEDRYGMTLPVYNSASGSSDAVDNTKSAIVSCQADQRVLIPRVPFGIKIYVIVLTPEQIAPMNFNLVDRALNLMCINYGNVDIKSYKRLLEKESILSHLVSKRESFQNCSVFENDKPDYVAVERGMLACDYLYKGCANEAEICLKEAISCVLKINSLGLRMLCKLTTYITWFCLASNTISYLKQLIKLLEEGIRSFEDDYKSLIGFPTEALGYMYYDFSRYYMCKYDNLRRCTNDQRNYQAERENRQKAVKKATISVEIFQQDNEKKKTKETHRRLLLAKCQHAYVKLGCGHEFKVISGEVSTDEIAQAEDIINSVQLDVADMPLVQNVNYLIALCDLQYRKERIEDALKTVETCLRMLEGKIYHTGYKRANNRLVKLKNWRS